ncbi:MAG: M64 family metallopeptidase [Desulfocapsa sp.]|nr:M64 family metallopeptidase [Desulfocapsa sp.]
MNHIKAVIFFVVIIFIAATPLQAEETIVRVYNVPMAEECMWNPDCLDDGIPAVVQIEEGIKETALRLQVTEESRMGYNDGLFSFMIIASGFSPEEMGEFRKKANSVGLYILGQKPFNSYADKTTLEIFENTEDLECRTGCAGIQRFLCCSPSKVIAVALNSQKLFDKILVMHNTEEYSGAGQRDAGDYEALFAETFATTYSGSFAEELSLHEMGHSAGNLCDEYLYPPGGYYFECPNCVATCEELSGDTCQLGCDARADFYRPEDSVMLSIKGVYNSPFNPPSEKSLRVRFDWVTRPPEVIFTDPKPGPMDKVILPFLYLLL